MTPTGNLSQQFKASGPSPWLHYLGPMLLGLLVSWGTANLAAGAFINRVTAAENFITEQKETNKTFATKDETRITNESVLRELNSIHDDVREIRKAVVEK